MYRQTDKLQTYIEPLESRRDKQTLKFYSKVAISALSNNIHKDYQGTIQCLIKLAELSGSALQLQWIPSHEGVFSNEIADVKARIWTESNQPDIPLTLRTSYNQINTTVDSVTSKTIKDLSKD
ncbi:hypothetical protein NPIL_309061 [Nephila pilipes]|uniref:RNase H type-1 domain-containing protein n=1 Tax=Nephila pilipes TaxID=299642 RepID=A0A8X6U118_NEPPI|nr:hypothetical protein NPIL_309061 [Nephila pilipes]